MTWAAVVLTGGRARRLDGASKADLVVDGRTLLASTYAACRDLGAQVVVVVGPEPDESPDLGSGGPRLVWTREDPPFSGPARGVAAGVATLARHHPAPGAAVAVLACDMPDVGRALPFLARAVMADGGPNPAGPRPGTSWGCVLGTSPGPGEARVQWLLGIHRWEPLRDACAALSPGGSGESVRQLLVPLRAREIAIPEQAAADIDTWADLRSRRECEPAGPVEPGRQAQEALSLGEQPVEDDLPSGAVDGRTVPGSDRAGRPRSVPGTTEPFEGGALARETRSGPAGGQAAAGSDRSRPQDDPVRPPPSPSTDDKEGHTVPNPSDPTVPAGSAAPPAELADWTRRALAALGLPEDDAPDAAVLLDLTREVAHQVTRTAGPLTCYLVGVAATRRGGRPEDLAQAVAEVRALLAEQ